MKAFNPWQAAKISKVVRNFDFALNIGVANTGSVLAVLNFGS